MAMAHHGAIQQNLVCSGNIVPLRNVENMLETGTKLQYNNVCGFLFKDVCSYIKTTG
jgi:hypothetical protein